MRGLVVHDLPPDAFAVVMATGIISIAATDHAYPRIDVSLAALAAAMFGLLLAGLMLRLLAGPASAFARARDPDIALRLFTFVAACAVLGARFDAHPTVVWPLASTAMAAWLILAPLAFRGIRSLPRAELRQRAHGAWLLASVATAGLAITAADLATRTRWHGWVLLSAAAWMLAVLLYLAITWLIAWRAATTPFTPEEVTPDSWILMGALAISTLAGVRLHAALGTQGSLPWLADALRLAIVALWVLASLWIPVLLYAEMWRVDHRTGSVRFAAVWWAAVFPLGMYSTATQATASQLHLPALSTVSLVFFWIAFSVWVLVAMGWLHSVVRAAHASPRRP